MTDDATRERARRVAHGHVDCPFPDYTPPRPHGEACDDLTADLLAFADAEADADLVTCEAEVRTAATVLYSKGDTVDARTLCFAIAAQIANRRKERERT